MNAMIKNKKSDKYYGEEAPTIKNFLMVLLVLIVLVALSWFGYHKLHLFH